MYAVVKTGGKQYRVTTNDVIIVEKLVAEPGSDVELDQVLALGGDGETEIGTPLVEGARGGRRARIDDAFAAVKQTLARERAEGEGA